MLVTPAHVFEKFADVLIGSGESVTWLTLDGREPLSAHGHGAAVKTPAEQSPVVLLQNKSKA